MIVTVIANQAGNFNWEYKVVIFLVCMIYCLHASHLGNRFWVENPGLQLTVPSLNSVSKRHLVTAWGLSDDQQMNH